jgi:hypothetical protein
VVALTDRAKEVEVLAMIVELSDAADKSSFNLIPKQKFRNDRIYITTSIRNSITANGNNTLFQSTKPRPLKAVLAKPVSLT